MIEEKIFELVTKWLKSFTFPDKERPRFDNAFIAQTARNKTRQLLKLINRQKRQ